MSLRLIALSPDLQRLQNEGYDLDIRSGYLLIKDVPYVNSQSIVGRGTLISRLDLSGDKTNKPTDHVAHWIGAHPCHSDGRKITAIENPSGPQVLFEGVQADFLFSAKADYRDYHHKMTSYIARIAGEAAKLEPEASARTHPAIPTGDDSSPFNYVDTASSRAGIVSTNRKLAGLRIGIVGLGGTGSYILDLVAKTEVAEIRIIDGDVFSQHNAFRAPGAPNLEELQKKPQKVERFGALYSSMHKGIVIHDVYLDETNLDLLDGLDYVFVCVDRAQVKRIIVDRLTANGTPFIEVGLGVVVTDGQLEGIVRVVTSTPETRDAATPHISFSDEEGGANEYATNIQIAELNAMNAAIAVMEWKRLVGVYRDSGRTFYSGYSLGSGEVVREKSE